MSQKAYNGIGIIGVGGHNHDFGVGGQFGDSNPDIPVWYVQSVRNVCRQACIHNAACSKCFECCTGFNVDGSRIKVIRYSDVHPGDTLGGRCVTFRVFGPLLRFLVLHRSRDATQDFEGEIQHLSNHEKDYTLCAVGWGDTTQ